jgi:hypothetical protein
MSVAKLKTMGTVTVTTGGTPVQLFPDSAFPNGKPKISSILVRALSANAGAIFVGDADVLASTERGDKLTANQSRGYSGDNQNNGGTMIFDIDNVWIDATSDGDGVDVCYIEVI